MALLKLRALGVVVLLVSLPIGCAQRAPARQTASSPAASTPGGVVDVQLLAFNDFHGNLEPPTGGNGRIGAEIAGGIEYFATQLTRLKAANPNTIIVSAGDNIGASPLLSSMFHDEPTIEALTEAGLQVSAVGNHELDEGWWELARMQRGGCHPVDGCQDKTPFAGAGFEYLAANVMLDPQRVDRAVLSRSGLTIDGNRPTTLFPASTVKEVAGVKVGFIGLTLEGAPLVISPANITGLTFTHEATAANAAATALKKQGVQTIVVLIHEGGTPKGPGYDGCEGLTGPIVQIAKEMSDDIDVVVSGHTHTAYNCTLGTKLVTSGASLGRLITDIDLRIDRASGRVVSKSAHNVIVARDVQKSPAETAILDHYRPMAATVGQRLVGTVSAPILSTHNEAGESPLGDVVADSMLDGARAPQSGGAVIAFMNAGAIRAELVGAPGADADRQPVPITYAQVFPVLPFGNTVVVRTLTGDAIMRLIEQQFDNPEPGRDMVLQVSRGFTYTYDRSRPKGRRVDPASVTLSGEALVPTRRYRVAMPDFVWSGGDGFSVATEGTEPVAAGADLDVFIAYLTSHAPVPPGPQDRIRRSK